MTPEERAKRNAFERAPELVPVDYAKKAKEAVALRVNTVLEEESQRWIEENRLSGIAFLPGGVTADDFYVVWFVKVLQNWKAMVSTDLVPGHYFEVTYNGDRLEAYVDWYTKASNAAIPDSYINDPSHIHLTD